MRVVVTLDDGLYGALQDRALKRGMSFQAVISEVLVRGLANAGPGRVGSSPEHRRGQYRRKGRPQKPISFDDLLSGL